MNNQKIEQDYGIHYREQNDEMMSLYVLCESGDVKAVQHAIQTFGVLFHCFFR